MSLLELPPEIITHMFDYVGAAYFRHDISRLTVCKTWSEFAFDTCFRDFYVHASHIDKILHLSEVDLTKLDKPVAETYSLDDSSFRTRPPASSLRRLHTCVRSLDVDFDHLEGTVLKREPNDEDKLRQSQPRPGSITRGNRLGWFLGQLGKSIQEAPRLQNLRLRAVLSDYFTGGWHRYIWVHLNPLNPFLSLGSLSTLDLDFCGKSCYVGRSSDDKLPGYHFCPLIGALLAQLRRLRLRLTNVCPTLFIPTSQKDRLRLEEVLLNLSHAQSFYQATYASSCCSLPDGFRRLQRDMREQAHVLARQMAAPKMVRILNHVRGVTHTHKVEWRAFDAVDRTVVRLQAGEAWDAEGRVIESEASDGGIWEVEEVKMAGIIRSGGGCRLPVAGV